ESTNVPLDGPTAHRLADLVGIERDLRWTARACEILARRADRHENVLIFLEGLHDAALIRYGRCFKEGRRTAFRIPKGWIEELPAHLREAPADALSLRDKHVAHSVNDWEINVPVAHVVRVKEYGAASVRSVSVSHQRALMLGIRAFRLLHELAKTLAERAAKVGTQVQAELLKEVRSISPRALER